MLGRIDAWAFAGLAVTIVAVAINPTMSKTIAALGGAYTGAVIAAA